VTREDAAPCIVLLAVLSAAWLVVLWS